MRKIIIFLLVLTFGFLETECQQVMWSKNYNFNNCISKGKSFVELSDSGFIVVGGASDTIQVIGNTIAMRLDKNGDTIWTRKYNFGSAVGNGAFYIEKITDTTFMIASGFYFQGESCVNIGIIDIDGDTL